MLRASPILGAMLPRIVKVKGEDFRYFASNLRCEELNELDRKGTKSSPLHSSRVMRGCIRDESGVDVGASSCTRLGCLGFGTFLFFETDHGIEGASMSVQMLHIVFSHNIYVLGLLFSCP